MTISDCISIVVAILVGGGTLALAFMTWKSIRQTRSIQKNEQRQRLLNEIIEWAMDAITCGFEIDIPEESEIDIKAYKVHFLGRLSDKLRAIQARGEYMKEIASASVFGQGLNSAVKKATDNLSRVIKNVELDIKGEDSEKTRAEKAEFEEYKKREGTLNQCLNKILEEAAKIKTRDIGQ